MCIMLSRSPNLEYLELPLKFKHLHSLRFPYIKKVKLHLLSGATTLVNSSSARFIENNPSIEELSWYPVGAINLMAGSLPNLKHLKTNLQVIRAIARESDGQLHAPLLVPTAPWPGVALPSPSPPSRNNRLPDIEEELEEESEDYADVEGGFAYAREQPPHACASPPASPFLSAPPPTPPFAILQTPPPPPIYTRNIESLDVSGLSAAELLGLAFLDRASLRRLSLSCITDVKTVIEVAAEFPNIEWLMLPVRHSPCPADPGTSSSASATESQALDIDTLLAILRHFRNLRIFRGRALWNAVGQGKSGEAERDKMHNVLKTLVEDCPKLEEVDHCDFNEKRWGFKRVVFNRNVDQKRDGEGTVDAAPYVVRRPFMRGCFDVLDGAFG